MSIDITLFLSLRIWRIDAHWKPNADRHKSTTLSAFLIMINYFGGFSAVGETERVTWCISIYLYIRLGKQPFLWTISNPNVQLTMRRSTSSNRSSCKVFARPPIKRSYFWISQEEGIFVLNARRHTRTYIEVPASHGDCKAIGIARDRIRIDPIRTVSKCRLLTQTKLSYHRCYMLITSLSQSASPLISSCVNTDAYEIAQTQSCLWTNTQFNLHRCRQTIISVTPFNYIYKSQKSQAQYYPVCSLFLLLLFFLNSFFLLANLEIPLSTFCWASTRKATRRRLSKQSTLRDRVSAVPGQRDTPLRSSPPLVQGVKVQHWAICIFLFFFF